MGNIAVLKMGESSQGNRYFTIGGKDLEAMAQRGDAGAHAEIQRRITGGSDKFKNYQPPAPGAVAPAPAPAPAPVPEPPSPETVPQTNQQCTFCFGWGHDAERCPSRSGAPAPLPTTPPPPPTGGATTVGVTAPKKEPSPRASSVRPHFKLTSIQLAQAVADGHPGALEEQQFRASLQPAKTAARQAKQSLMTATGAELRALVAQGNMEAQAEIHRRAANRAAKGKKPVGVR